MFADIYGLRYTKNLKCQRLTVVLLHIVCVSPTAAVEHIAEITANIFFFPLLFCLAEQPIRVIFVTDVLCWGVNILGKMKGCRQCPTSGGNAGPTAKTNATDAQWWS